MARTPGIIRRVHRDQRLHVLHDRVHHVRAREAVLPVHDIESPCDARVPREARDDARERTSPAEMRVLDHFCNRRMQVGHASVVKVHGGERGIVHGTRQHAVVDPRVGAAGPQMVAGAADQPLRPLRAGEPPVIEQLPPDLGAAVVVREDGRQRHEPARAGRVDAELPVEFLALRGRLRLGLRLKPGSLLRKPPCAHTPCDEEPPRQHKHRACTGDQPFDAPCHFSASFSFGSGNDTPSRRSISGNSGDHTRAEP